MKFIFIILFFYSITFANQLFFPLPQNIKYDKSKVMLGKKLFFDPILSKNKDISCFSCHKNYGTDNLPVSIGTNGKKGTMNSLSIFNLAFKMGYFWNGRSHTLKEQMLDGPLFNPFEMANSKTAIVKRLSLSKEYRKLFEKAYGKKPSFDLMLDALVAFQKTLISVNSKFDRFLRKETTLTAQETKGLHLFINYGCVSCHNGINIGGNSYQKLGSVIPLDKNIPQTKDRTLITHNPKDRLTFIVPSLRNVEKTYPYFHDGSVKTLKDAIQRMAYYNIGVVLKKEEVYAIESFLKTLTGEIPETFRDKK